MIGQHCQDLTMFMMDDDIRFYRRKSMDDTHLIGVTRDQVGTMLDELQENLMKYAAVGISAREGNNNLDAPLSINSRLMRAIGYQTDVFNAMEHNRVDVMEDFDVLLQIVRSGRPIANMTLWAQNQSGTNIAGGCSTWRTHEIHNASAKRLQELHPEFVSLRQKENKTGGDFGKRTEVTISWKKAFERGRTNVNS